MKKITINLDSYNYDALKRGLAHLGLNIETISDEDLANMLSYALGYVDFTDDEVVRELLKNK